MSTSPSWFDQEKFSRLVKKVGPKTVTEVLPSNLGADPESRPSGDAPASTSRISLVSKPPSLLSEQRALPALPRRSGPLPSIKPIFPSQPTAPVTTAPPESVVETSPIEEQVKENDGAVSETEDEIEPTSESGDNDLTEVWHKMSLLNEELARAIQERDQAQSEGTILREQLRVADGESTEKKDAPAPTEDVARMTKERDEAVAETEFLRAQLLQFRDSNKEPKEPSAPGKTQELGLLTNERDQARRQYADLRKQFETLKQEQTPPKEETIKFRKEWEQQLEELKQKLADRDKEIAALKASSASANSSAADGDDDKKKQEILSLRDQITRLKDEASIAQRGLALSQKALQQTRDTLREATEGTSLSRHNFDNLKNECATLAQQNTVLQTQNETLARDLAAAKSKITTRL